ncbi:DNA/RNA nuclease SfsA [Desulfovibrio sp. OttesenSCG-928-I05]|nr:DNA/RNA nuclease SfsA [Desulfovibrio sp. OttesenSCG-928-I05]
MLQTQTPPLLRFPPGCRQAVFVRRIKRFFVECASAEGPLWAHTNNSGAMTGMVRPGSPAWLSPALKEGRALPWTLELIGLYTQIPGFPANTQDWAGVNTLTPNRLLRAAFEKGLLPWAAGYSAFKAEARRGASRLDALLTGPGLPPLWVECKNVTLVEGGVAAFPDAVSERAHKHMREMADIIRSGERAAFFYCIQRPDARCFAPAEYVDAEYARLFHETRALGVESHPHHVYASPQGISLGSELAIAG